MKNKKLLYTLIGIAAALIVIAVIIVCVVKSGDKQKQSGYVDETSVKQSDISTDIDDEKIGDIDIDISDLLG